MSSLIINPKLIKNKKLLWTNPNPNNSFAPSNNIVDVSGYNVILFDMIVSTSDAGVHYLIYKINDDFTTRSISKTWDSSFGNILSTRDVFIINNKAGVGDGYYLGIGSSSNEGQSNQMSIPYKIYGIID